jgi:hypothetical protein
MRSAETTDAVDRFCAASVTNDVDGMISALAPDAELVSPMLLGWLFAGTTTCASCSKLCSAACAICNGESSSAMGKPASRSATRASLDCVSTTRWLSTSTTPAASGDSAYICGAGCLSQSGRWRLGSSSADIRVFSAVRCTYTPHRAADLRPWTQYLPTAGPVIPRVATVLA